MNTLSRRPLLLHEMDPTIRRSERDAIMGGPEERVTYQRAQIRSGRLPDEIEHFHKASEALTAAYQADKDSDYYDGSQERRQRRHKAIDDLVTARNNVDTAGRAVATIAHNTGYPLGRYLDRSRIHPEEFGRALHLVSHQPSTRDTYGPSRTTNERGDVWTNWHVKDQESDRHLNDALRGHGYKPTPARLHRNEVRIVGDL